MFIRINKRDYKVTGIFEESQKGKKRHISNEEEKQDLKHPRLDEPVPEETTRSNLKGYENSELMKALLAEDHQLVNDLINSYAEVVHDTQFVLSYIRKAEWVNPQMICVLFDYLDFDEAEFQENFNEIADQLHILKLYETRVYFVGYIYLQLIDNLLKDKNKFQKFIEVHQENIINVDGFIENLINTNPLEKYDPVSQNQLNIMLKSYLENKAILAKFVEIYYEDVAKNMFMSEKFTSYQNFEKYFINFKPASMMDTFYYLITQGNLTAIKYMHEHTLINFNKNDLIESSVLFSTASQVKDEEQGLAIVTFLIETCGLKASDAAIKMVNENKKSNIAKYLQEKLPAEKIVPEATSSSPPEKIVSEAPAKPSPRP